MTAGRSPAYPYVDLGKAVDLIKKIHSYAKTHSVDVVSLFKHLGFKGLTGSARKTLAALKYYGLLNQPHGSKEVKLTARAMHILHGIPGTAEHTKALNDAFLAPAINSYCWERWGNDSISDEVIRSHLILNKGFNDSTVQGFINDYKLSRNIAKMASSVDLGAKGAEIVTPKEGDYIQWVSQGVDQFTEPRKVLRVSEDDGFLHVENSQTGIPIAEVLIVDSPAPPAQLAPTVKPGMQPPTLLPLHSTGVAGAAVTGVSMRQETFVLDDGAVTIQWPATMTEASYKDFTEWLDILKRKVGRTVVKDQKVVPASENADSVSFL